MELERGDAALVTTHLTCTAGVIDKYLLDSPTPSCNGL
jgi:hypothetical protein